MELAVVIEGMGKELAVVIEGMREENCYVKVVSAKPVDLTPSE